MALLDFEDPQELPNANEYVMAYFRNAVGETDSEIAYVDAYHVWRYPNGEILWGNVIYWKELEV